MKKTSVKAPILPFPTPADAKMSAARRCHVFLDTDFDSNWYLIPVDRRGAWEGWLDKNENVFRPKLPRYVLPVGSDASRVEFNGAEAIVHFTEEGTTGGDDAA